MTGTARRVGQAIAATVVIALLALLVWKVTQRDGGVAADLAQGKTPSAPAFTLERIDAEGDGQMLSMADLRGRPVIVNFWASWCAPCRDEVPALQATYEKHRGEGLVVLGVDFNDVRRDAKRFLERYGATYPVVYDGKGETLGRWGVRQVPETYFVDRAGHLVGVRIAGGVDIERNQELYDKALQQILDSKPS
jgi:cytochrome c biogenesis protein CcmG/thiol:disulfide interchange protein DsbE